MGLQSIKDNLKYLSHKDAEKAKKYIDGGDWDSLLYLLDAIVDDANIDVVLAAEEDNGQTVKEKSELLEHLMNLKFEVEDYVEENDLDEYEDDFEDSY